MVLKAYKYLYFRIYSWNLKTWGESDLPQYNALFGVSFLVFLNLMSIPTAIDLVSQRDILAEFGIGQLGVLLFGFSIIIVSYFLLVKDKKFLAIAKDFASETPHDRKRRLVWIWLYVIGTFVLAYGLVAIK